MVNLAVVGAGIGGCCAAYFARKYFPGVDVTIYEAQGRIGGRILTHNLGRTNFELGASFLSSLNRVLLGIAFAQQLKMKPVEESMNFSIWNGSELIFRSNKQSYATILRLLAKNKLSLTRTFLLLKKAKSQVNRLYENEQKNPSDMAEIFESTGLNKYHQKTFSEALEERGASQAFINEIVTPITRVIYSQNATLGGFAGLSSLIGVYSGVTSRLVNGNSALPVHLAERSNAAVKLNKKVEKVEKMPNGSYRVYAGDDKVVFDAVIIATPLELANIELDGFSLPDWEPQTYQTVHQKIMRGTVDLSCFGLENYADPPAMVLTTKDADPITHYRLHKTDNNEFLVTFSSTKPLDSKKLNALFKNGAVTVLDHCWKAAYPIFKPLAKLPPTCIDKRLMYINAIEPSVASMEASALSALNAVRMLGLPAQQVNR